MSAEGDKAAAHRRSRPVRPPERGERRAARSASRRPARRRRAGPEPHRRAGADTPGSDRRDAAGREERDGGEGARMSLRWRGPPEAAGNTTPERRPPRPQQLGQRQAPGWPAPLHGIRRHLGAHTRADRKSAPARAAAAWPASMTLPMPRTAGSAPRAGQRTAPGVVSVSSRRHPGLAQRARHGSRWRSLAARRMATTPDSRSCGVMGSRSDMDAILTSAAEAARGGPRPVAAQGVEVIYQQPAPTGVAGELSVEDRAHRQQRVNDGLRFLATVQALGDIAGQRVVDGQLAPAVGAGRSRSASRRRRPATP